MKLLPVTIVSLLLSLLSCGVGAESSISSAQQVEPIILINPFVVPADKLEETVNMWEQARDFLQQQPGYLSTALHQSLLPDAQYQLINVAQWQSVEAFKAATGKMRKQANLPRIEGVKPNPQLYRVIRRD